MKARIKGTNIIVKCEGVGTSFNGYKGIMCEHIDGSREVIPADCLIEIGEKFDIKEQFNWQSFRAESAKDILCAIIPRYEGSIDKEVVEYAIFITDNLISKLKEKKQ